MSQKRTFYIKTFGCQMNYADSEKVHRMLLQCGMLKVLDPVSADVVILNTCSVRQKGEDKVFGFIHEIRKATLATGKTPLIGITGCMVRKTGMAQRYIQGTEGRVRPKKITLLASQDEAETNTHNGVKSALENYDDELFWRSKDIDFVFRIEETGHLSKILSHILGEDIGNDEKWEEYLKIKQTQENPTSANVIIQTGCDNFCTFCIVPHTRGREVSRSIEEIVEEVAEVVGNGSKEVTLLGQNVNSYGKLTRAKLWNSESLTWNDDVRANITPFRELLNALGAIPGLDRIRFTSSNPHDMTRDILDAHFEIDTLCPYLHFALQSGSDRVLKAMNRKHTYTDFKSQVEYLRSKNPLFSISTDIIVGFPGETLEDFEATAEAMQECEFDFAYIARYSVRNGTVAGDKLEDDVPAAEKARRWGILNEILSNTSRTRNERMVGRTEEVLITGVDHEGRSVGRTRNFKEVCFVEAIPAGSLVTAKITAVSGWMLAGELLTIGV